MENGVDAASVSSPQTYQVEFNGKASEYFRIWIVNLVLTVLTLGVYSAWAKVRTRRYFYNNTVINGATFDYHADPLRILKGRIILAVLFAIYFSARFVPMLWIVVLCMLPLVPWLIVRGMIFNMNNTSYRGVRFGFEKNYKEAYKTYIKGLLLAIVTLGLGFIWMPFWHHRFLATHSRFGKTKFSFSGTRGQYEKPIGQAFLMGIGFFICLVISTFFVGFAFKGSAVNMPVMKSIFVMVYVLAIYIPFFYLHAFVTAGIGNFYWRSTHLEGVGFKSNYTGFDLFGIYFGNIVLCIFTLGLGYPWARMAITKYRIAHTQVIARPEAFAQFQQGDVVTQQGGVGDNFVDMWDIDLGF